MVSHPCSWHTLPERNECDGLRLLVIEVPPIDSPTNPSRILDPQIIEPAFGPGPGDHIGKNRRHPEQIIGMALLAVSWSHSGR